MRHRMDRVSAKRRLSLRAWLLLALAALVMITVGCSAAPAGGARRTAPLPPDTERETEAPPEFLPVRPREPEDFTEFEMSEISFRMDKGLQYRRRKFLDMESGTIYQVSSQYGVDAAKAWDTLTRKDREYRDSSLYDRLEAVYQGDELLVPLDESCRYNIVSVYLSGGWVFHTAAVLSEDGALFTVEAEHDQAAQSPEDVRANLMYTLNSVRFEGPAVTEENYQSQIHLAEKRDCQYMAAAYIRTGLFGHDAFVDAYVPFSEEPVYSDDGRSIQTEAHGLRVRALILPGENAKEVVDGQYQALAEGGRVYEADAEEDTYREDLDIACKLTVYEEGGQKRYAVLYADGKWEGYYLFREITSLPEETDFGYLPLLMELEGIFGLSLPVLRTLGP